MWPQDGTIRINLSKGNLEADVLNSVIAHINESDLVLPTVILANEPSKIHLRDLTPGSDGRGFGNSNVYGVSQDEIRNMITFINYAASEAPPPGGDDEVVHATVWGFQPSQGAISSVITGCPHGTSFVAFYYIKDDFILDRITTLQTVLNRVGPGNHTSIRSIEQGPVRVGTTAGASPYSDRGQAVHRLLTVRFQFATTPNPTGYESIPAIMLFHDNCLNSITIKGTKTLLMEHDDIIAQFREAPDAILEQTDVAPWNRDTHDARRFSVLDTVDTLGDDLEWMHQLMEAHSQEEVESLSVFLHSPNAQRQERIFLIQHLSIGENLEKILLMASELRIQTIPGRGNSLVVKTTPEGWETFRSRLLQVGVNLPAKFAQGTRSFEIQASSNWISTYKMQVPGAQTGISLQIHIPNHSLLLRKAEELHRFVLGEAQLGHLKGSHVDFDVKAVTHPSKGDITVVTFEVAAQFLFNITALVESNRLVWQGLPVEVQFLMPSPTSNKWKRLSHVVKESRREHHENYSSREPDTNRRLLINLWSSPDPFALSLLGQVMEDTRWIYSGARKGNIPIRAFSLNTDESELMIADVGTDDIQLFVDGLKRNWVRSNNAGFRGSSVLQTKEFLGSEPGTFALYVPGKTSLPVKVGNAKARQSSGSQGDSRRNGKAGGLLVKAFSGLFMCGSFANCAEQILWQAMERDGQDSVMLWRESAPTPSPSTKHKPVFTGITAKKARKDCHPCLVRPGQDSPDLDSDMPLSATPVRTHVGSLIGAPPLTPPSQARSAKVDLLSLLGAKSKPNARTQDPVVPTPTPEQVEKLPMEVGGEETIEVASDDDVMGQSPPDRGGPCPALDELMGQTPLAVAARARRPYPRRRGGLDAVEEGNPGDNACHLASALRLLAHSDWPPGVSFKRPLHVLLRHVAKGGRQSDAAVQAVIHQSLTMLYPFEPMAQQDALCTLMKTVEGLPKPTQEAIDSTTWVDEACLAHQCRQADSVHNQRNFAHLGNHAAHPPDDLQAVLNRFPAEYLADDRLCSACGKQEIKRTIGFTDLRASAVISHLTSGHWDEYPTFVGQTGVLPGLRKIVMCVAELRFIGAAGRRGAAGHYIVVEYRSNGRPFIYDPLGNRQAIAGETVAFVIRTQDHINRFPAWEAGHPSPALIDDTTARPVATPIRAPDPYRLGTLRNTAPKSVEATLVASTEGCKKYDKHFSYGVISVFDGSGCGVSTIVQALNGLRPSAVLAAEEDPRIRPMVQEHMGFNPAPDVWQSSKTTKAGRYVNDVWDIVRNKAEALREFLALLGKDDPIVLIAGGPDRDLTRYGPFKGKLGVCGATSRHFNIIPTIVSIIHHIEPTRFIFVITEHASTILPIHLEYMLQTLGLQREVVKTINSKEWTDVARKRIYLSNGVGAHMPAFRNSKWEGDWQPGMRCTTSTDGRRQYHRGKLMPLLRARGRNAMGQPIHATGAYHPANLLYSPHLLGGIEAFEGLWKPGETIPSIPWKDFFQTKELLDAWNIIIQWPIKERIIPSSREDNAAATLATAFAAGTFPFRPPGPQERMEQAEIFELYSTLVVTRPLLTAAVCTDIVGNSLLPSALTAAMHGIKEGGLASTLFPAEGQAGNRMHCTALKPDALKHAFRLLVKQVSADLALEQTANDIGNGNVGKAMKQLHATGFPRDVYDEINDDWLEVVKACARSTPKPNIRLAREFNILDVPYIQWHRPGAGQPPPPPIATRPLLVDPEIKTWSALSAVFVQNVVKAVLTEIHPSSLQASLPCRDDANDSHEDTVRLPADNIFTLDQVLTRWAHATQNNVAQASVISFPQFPAKGQTGQAHISNVRMYGSGNGQLFVVRQIEGKLYVGLLRDPVILGSAFHEAIAELQNRYVLYKSTNEESFGDVDSELRNHVVVGVRQGGGEHPVCVLHNNFEGNGTTCNLAKGAWNRWVLVCLLGHQFVDGETFSNFPFILPDLPSLSEFDSFILQALEVRKQAGNLGLFGACIPNAIIICSTDQWPCGDSDLTFSSLPPPPPPSSSSPSVLLVIVSSSARLAVLLIPIIHFPRICPSSERLRLFLAERGAEGGIYQ